jgi:CspA family cold shock protein
MVRFFLPEEGWGAIASADLPDGDEAFVHFSAIDATGYRSFDEGDVVDFDFEPAQQDGYRYVATWAARVR